jgi:hypothetical protein
MIDHMTLLSGKVREDEQYDKMATNKMNDLETLPRLTGWRKGDAVAQGGY